MKSKQEMYPLVKLWFESSILKQDFCERLKNSKEERWRITTASDYKYLNQLAIRASELRRVMKERTIEKLHKRTNVEATIFQLSFFLCNNKTRYRGHLNTKHGHTPGACG